MWLMVKYFSIPSPALELVALQMPHIWRLRNESFIGTACNWMGKKPPKKHSIQSDCSAPICWNWFDWTTSRFYTLSQCFYSFSSPLRASLFKCKSRRCPVCIYVCVTSKLFHPSAPAPPTTCWLKIISQICRCAVSLCGLTFVWSHAAVK